MQRKLVYAGFFHKKTKSKVSLQDVFDKRIFVAELTFVKLKEKLKKNLKLKTRRENKKHLKLVLSLPRN